MRAVHSVIATAAAAWLLATATAQQTTERSEAVAERVRAGGWFETSQFRRADDGTLEVLAAPRGPDGARVYASLVGDNVFEGDGLHAAGMLLLVCHGPGDLLGMTDATLHFGALGISDTDAALRQYIVVPPPSFDGARGRAELLDRLVAIDTLVRRGCESATVELRVLAENEQLPPVLRERARRGADELDGKARPIARRRLDPATVRLPLVFDACVVVQHDRLPHLDWLPAVFRRIEAVRHASQLTKLLVDLNAFDKHQAQRACDAPGELPFAVAHRYGNGRLDHSLVVISVSNRSPLGVALTWEAAGELEHVGWQDARVSDAGARNNPLFAGKLAMTANHLFASSDGSDGKARPELAAKLGIGNDDGIAIRVVLPATSKAWPALAFLKTPRANGAELRISFGDPAVIVLAIDAGDEDTAAEWVEFGQRWCADLRTAREQWPEAIRQSKELAPVLDAALQPAFSTKGVSAFATIELRGVTREKVQAIVQLLLAQPAGPR